MRISILSERYRGWFSRSCQSANETPNQWAQPLGQTTDGSSSGKHRSSTRTCLTYSSISSFVGRIPATVFPISGARTMPASTSAWSTSVTVIANVWLVTHSPE